MTAVCKWAFWIVGVLYLVALGLLLIGTFGLFGQERDPLAGVFLMPLGLPWVLSRFAEFCQGRNGLNKKT